MYYISATDIQTYINEFTPRLNYLKTNYPERAEPYYKLAVIEKYLNNLDKVEERIQNGFRLFGKYYQALWD